MKIIVGIDGDNYTELDYGFMKTKEKAFECFKGIAKENYECFEIEKEGENRFTGYYYDDLYSDIPNFIVYECYDLNEKPYILVWWHAYNGVDFKVEQFDTFEEANAAMKAESDYVWIEENDPDYKGVGPDDTSSCIDTGYEWECWEIIKRSEL